VYVRAKNRGRVLIRVSLRIRSRCRFVEIGILAFFLLFR
jgi:hypothetical protein